MAGDDGADQGRTIRVPAQVVDTINRMARVERQLTQTFNRAPTHDEVAEAMGLKTTKVEELKSVSQEPVSLAAPVGEDSTELGEMIEDEHQRHLGSDMAASQRDAHVSDLVTSCRTASGSSSSSLRPRGQPPAHAGGGRPPFRGDPRARPSDRDSHAPQARRRRRERRAAPLDRLRLLHPIRSSSMAEHPAVNRRVVSSSLTCGASRTGASSRRPLTWIDPV